MATYHYQPDYAASPGAVLEEHLASRDFSHTEFARRCGLPVNLISGIVAGKASVEPATALQLEKVLGMDAHIWLGIEADYRLHKKEPHASRFGGLRICRPGALDPPDLFSEVP